MQAEPLLRVAGLRRGFGSRPVLEDVSFELAAGGAIAVFGPNGAGKTTLLRVLAGSLRPTAGAVFLDGRSQEDLGRDWYRRIGVVSHKSFLYRRLTVQENLTFYSRMFGLSDSSGRVAERLEVAGLSDRAGQPVSELSRGLEQRLAIARALLHDPDLLLLDEPFAGLDSAAAARLATTLGKLRDAHRAVVLVTHDLRQGKALADQAFVLVDGRLGGLAPVDSDLETFEGSYHRRLARAEA